MIYQLFVYIPESHLEGVKSALFKAGAGRYQHYDCCAWQVLGEGQFRALEGSNPFIGQHNQVSRVSEYRVEMICQADYLPAVLMALRESHPYEEPAYGLIPLQT